MLAPEFFDAFNYVSDNGLMGGTDATHFSPYLSVTRGMFVTVLYRYSKSTASFSMGFEDVPSGSYYYYPIAWAAHYGIVNGVTPTTFDPDGIITREQMAVILYRYAVYYEHNNYTTSSFRATPHNWQELSGRCCLNTNERTLDVSGQCMTYSAWLEIGIHDFEYFYITGKNADSFSLHYDKNTITLNGLTQEQEFGFADTNSLYPKTMTLSFSDDSRIDLSQITSKGIIYFSEYNDPSIQKAFPLHRFKRSSE